MKLTRNTKRASGMTLLELTVVILVLLSLISILFVGARAWKKGSDRAASILTIRNVQQAVRSYSNMNGHNPGDAEIIPGATSTSSIFGPGKFMENDPTDVPTFGTHPAGATTTYVIGAPTIIPLVGTLYMTTGGTDAVDYTPDPADILDW